MLNHCPVTTSTALYLKADSIAEAQAEAVETLADEILDSEDWANDLNEQLYSRENNYGKNFDLYLRKLAAASQPHEFANWGGLIKKEMQAAAMVVARKHLIQQ